ncbi:hypothetical protein ASPACDRAFT_51424 [Aspergillus aculeatus ATCC 16872]|uniref:GED domain-containing protein n=1 Tax=Aspergillus aculeatus (strain ATCC 16872 / CBS 172.66 / WB 5094) TaxID=690307 RepID=A0A1L9WZD5_ASPA1|nr:uncharacterized protein ASPACDRAFT_51424 [Aspergillus aculeatus ATCC 16872]OJK01635.1 hypothetical protein ASPACDRAFT_51424 [Aspergillus aculeatus ATCC 16872]
MRQLQSEQSRVLDIVDELRTIGVGALVELPQLIVCGNQSSGKSSVLEAISRVRFPAKSNVCTRFATEVILRRRPSSSIKRLRGFTSEAFSNGDDLPSLIEKAKECMEITESVNAGFSDDVLKVEISGPDKPELTLVDLPGLYYSTSQDQGRKGISIVRGITERYMKNTRSIIMAVITAKADYHLQEVLDMARKFDPQRERTLGIITQPDILEPSSEEEDTYLQFLRNDKVSLQLGWHALRNRSFETRDASDDARDEKEAAFFEQGRWASIPSENVGIDSLRRRLSNILFKHIRRNLPELVTDVRKKIEIRQSRLTTLGEARSSLQQQRGFLLGISTGFEKITGQALNGMYSDRFFEDGPEYILMGQDDRRLRAMIRELNECFAEAMSVRGKRRTIIHGWNQILSRSDIAALSAKPYMKDWEYSCVSRESLELELNSQARRKRGIELPGSANQLLVGDLFRDQARPWEEIAREHMMHAWSVVRYFIHSVLQHLTTEHTYSLIATSLIDPELDKMKESLLAKLKELTAYTKRGHPLPVGKSFLSKIQESRDDRQFKALEQRLLSSKNASADASFTLNDLKKATTGSETEGNEFAAAEIIDQMQAYYDVMTFVDNVAILGIENCLLAPLETIFTAQTINNLSDERIQDLASEPSSVEQERKRLSEDLRKLQEGLSTLRLFSTQMPTLSKPMVFSKVPLTTQSPLFNARTSIPFRSTNECEDSKKNGPSCKCVG